ncbi:hypothetical protein [Mycobacterium interjectum]|uniref:hypothetical protein n=1 Tax=Mycobacterium interjectum TaxID=33895 RepID=UPI00082B6DE8|nr:hypothetical protein [Mycobacterium interjectum]MCV7090025.1 hypothetical protein [Mycobacterium interjectum]
MSDTETPDTPPEPTETVEPDAPAPSPTEPEGHSREAKYRKALRDTEAERDQLRTRLETRDTADVERDLAGRLVDPGDLWRAGVTLDDLRGDDGELDPDRIDEAVTTVVAEHPHWAVNPVSPAAPASQVTSDGRPNLDADQATTWQGLFDRARNTREA